jgi:hypothetical protein
MNIMTPKEKANELVNKFIPPTRVKDIEENWVDDLYYAKQCALMAIDEVLNLLWHTHKNEIEYRYWNEVKQEIEKK